MATAWDWRPAGYSIAYPGTRVPGHVCAPPIPGRACVPPTARHTHQSIQQADDQLVQVRKSVVWAPAAGGSCGGGSGGLGAIALPEERTWERDGSEGGRGDGRGGGSAPRPSLMRGNKSRTCVKSTREQDSMFPQCCLLPYLAAHLCACSGCLAAGAAPSTTSTGSTPSRSQLRMRSKTTFRHSAFELRAGRRGKRHGSVLGL